MGFRGIDVRQSGDRLLLRALLLDSAGAKVTTGSADLYLYELQSDGSLKSFDFRDKSFKTGTLIWETQALTHQTGNAGATNTGVWTAAVEVEPELDSESSQSVSALSSESSPADETPFTPGNIYLALVNHSSASPPWQGREFQYGHDQGDLPMTYGEVDGLTFTPTTSAFETDLTATIANHFVDAYILFLTGSLAGQTGKVVAGYETPAVNPNGKGKITSLLDAFSSAPAHGDKFMIVGASA